MILPDHEIKKLLKERKLVIEPLEDLEIQVQPAGIDLRLDNEFRVFKLNSTPYIDTKKPTDNYTEKIILKDSEPFIVHPGEFVLAKIKEYVKMPADLVGSIDGKSSLGRLGIVVHTTSSSVNPGWEGHLVLEITNLSRMPVAIYPGMRIVKLTFHQLSSPSERPYGERKDTKYNKQESVDETKVYKEFSGK